MCLMWSVGGKQAPTRLEDPVQNVTGADEVTSREEVPDAYKKLADDVIHQKVEN